MRAALRSAGLHRRHRRFARPSGISGGKLPLSERHIRDANRWAFALIAIAFLVLTANLLGVLSAGNTSPRPATESAKAHP